MKKIEVRLFNFCEISDIEHISDKNIYITDNTISEISKKKFICPKNIDCKGRILLPGLFDIQINGWNNILFIDVKSEKELVNMCNSILNEGITSFFATLVSPTKKEIIDFIKIYRNSKKIINLKGIHIEGPFIDKNKKGIHPENRLRKPDADDIDIITKNSDIIKLITLSPEVVEKHTLDILNSYGIKIFAGHSNISYEKALESFKNNIIGVTHIFNAMSGISAREPGLVLAAIDSNVYTSIIGDTNHVHKVILKRLLSENTDKRILISDNIGIDKQKDSFKIFGKEIYKKDNLMIDINGTIAGSCLSLKDIFLKIYSLSLVSLKDLVKITSRNPGKLFGIKTGIISKGYSAEFILFDIKDNQITTCYPETLLSRKNF